MAHYVLADIHGNAKRFHEMLEKIAFSPEDMLYILGDVIDRGPDGIALLREVKGMPNVRMLLGNHEYMLLQSFSEGTDEDIIRNWKRNGGDPTIRAFMELAPQGQAELFVWLCGVPVLQTVTVNDQRFILVHAWLDGEDYYKIWGRPTSLTQRSSLLPDGAKLIIGHTPVALLEYPDEREQEIYFRKLEETGQHMRILHTEGYIDIDCGCGHNVPGAALACLRLEDMEEFYT